MTRSLPQAPILETPHPGRQIDFLMKKAFLLILIVVCVGIGVWFWLRMVAGGLPWPVYLHDTGRLFALTGFILLVFQFVLSSRIKWVEKGIGLDALLVMHKLCGGLILALATVHPLLILLSERLQGYAAPMGFLKILGLLALLLVWVTAGAALLYGKISLAYETWKGIHRVGYVILPLAFLHSLFIGSTLQRGPLRGFWMILALIYVAVLTGKIRKQYVLRRHAVAVSDVRKETEDIWTLHFEGDHPRYDPGQFLFLGLVRKGRVSAPHPFTIASSPMRKRFSICAKAVGDFTSSLEETRPSDPAYVDMPYGVFSFLNHDARRLVFIAGGIGITPFLSMLRYMQDRGDWKEVILLWANKREKDMAFRAELDRMAAGMPSFKVVYVLSRQEDWPGEKGHIDREKLEKYVENFTEGHFFLCGPPPMMADVKNTLCGLGVRKRRIHAERFALR